MQTVAKKKVFVAHPNCHDCTIEAGKYKPDWEIVMETINPQVYNGANRPRRCSLHTIALFCGRKDIIGLAKEMEASKKVAGYRCPDVRCLIFYLDRLSKMKGMIDTRDANVWKQVESHVKENPYPTIKGFKRFGATDIWTGGSYGKGKQIKGTSGMNVPSEPEDYDYARLVIKRLKDAGYTPGIEDPANIPSDEVLATTLQ